MAKMGNNASIRFNVGLEDDPKYPPVWTNRPLRSVREMWEAIDFFDLTELQIMSIVLAATRYRKFTREGIVRCD